MIKYRAIGTIHIQVQTERVDYFIAVRELVLYKIDLVLAQEPADSRVIISRSKIIRSRLDVIILAAVSERIAVLA